MEKEYFDLYKDMLTIMAKLAEEVSKLNGEIKELREEIHEITKKGNNRG